MTTILLVEKNGDVKPLRVKVFDDADLFKKCGFKTRENFERRHSWRVGDGEFVLYAKTRGRAEFENKYEFPPSAVTGATAATDLYFGTCAIVKRDLKSGAAQSTNAQEWRTAAERLHGMFEDLGSQDSSSSSEDEAADAGSATAGKQSTTARKRAKRPVAAPSKALRPRKKAVVADADEQASAGGELAVGGAGASWTSTTELTEEEYFCDNLRSDHFTSLPVLSTQARF